MKILVVLIFICLAGCNDGHYKSPPQNQVEIAKDAYWQYVQQSTSTPKDCVQDIRHSPPGQHLCGVISKSIKVVHTFFHLVYAHIVSWINNFFHKLCHEIDHLKHDLVHFLHHLEDDIHHHVKELVAEIHYKLDELKKHAAHHIESLDPHGLKITLMQNCKELEEHLDKCFEHLHSHHHHGHHHHGHHHHGHHHHGHHHHGHHHHGHHHHGHHHHGHHHHGHHHHGHHHHGHHHHGHHHHGHHHHGHHHHGHHHHGHHHHGHHHHGHHHHGHHHHGHHHHGHHHHHQPKPHCHHHHGHDHGPCMKKKVDECMEGFKITLTTLIHKFELELANTASEINKKLDPPKTHRDKLVKNSDHLQDELENIWKEWKSLSQKKTS